MTHRECHAERARLDPACVPQELTPGVVILDRLRGSRLQEIGRAFRCHRPRGYGAVALFAVAVLFFAAGPKGGVRNFLELIDKRMRRRLGALVGERSVPTAGSLSRALVRFEPEAVRDFVRWLLRSSLRRELLEHSSMQHHDAMNEGWHVADIDPTVDAIRRRDLPEGPDLPPGKRRAGGEPGYTGRKRGEARMRRVPVIHDGSGMWLSMMLLPTEGSIVPACRQLARDAVEALTDCVPGARVVLRGDGEFGSAGAMKAMDDSGAKFVCRLPRNGLLLRDEVAPHLATARWYRVPPGESAVPRQAAELGVFTLRGSKGAEDAEAIVTARVVVTRIPRPSGEPDHGIVVDDHQLELFATTLDPQAWPAPDVVRLFHGRASIENRFAQSNREFDLERTFSFTPAGQEWMCGVALFLWNELTTIGWEQARPLPAPPAGDLRPAEEPVIDPLPVNPADPVAEEPIVDARQVDPEPVPVADESVLRAADAAAPLLEALHPGPSALVPRVVLASILARAFADVDGSEGWSVDASKAEIRCPEKRVLRPFSSSGTTKAGGPRLSVRTEPWACEGCPRRARCYDGTGPYKCISRSVSADDQRAAAEAMAQLRSGHPPAQRPKPTQRRPPPQGTAAATSPPGKPIFTPAAVVAFGPYVCRPPQFLPAEARRLARDSMRGPILLRVSRPSTRRPPPSHPLIADTAAKRAHRRQTRAQVAAAGAVDRRVTVRHPRSEAAESTI